MLNVENDDIGLQGNQPYYSISRYIPVLLPYEKVTRRNVIFVPKMPVFSIVRNMEGYIVSPLIDEQGDDYIAVRYADCVVHVYSLESDVWGNVYPSDLYKEIDRLEYCLDSLKNPNAANRYSDCKVFHRTPSCSYTYLIYRIKQYNKRLVYVECADWKSYVAKAHLSPHIAITNDFKWDGLADSFEETASYTGKKDLLDYSPVQDYLDYTQDHIDL